MNIFYLDRDVSKCAEYHNDKHVVKMILESCQLLYTTHWVTGSKPTQGYKATHVKHPCSLWLLESLDNYRWLISLAKELCREYTFRYKKHHACEVHVAWLSDNEPQLASRGVTNPRQAMPEHYKRPNPVVAYRLYYCGDKLRFATYKGRKTPHWLLDAKMFAT
jgi:hypothetical protein